MANFATTGANRVPRILFFIESIHPTEDEKNEVARFGPNVGIRNATQVAGLAMSALEECDAVAGKVPDRYAAVYPDVSGMDMGGRLMRMSDLDRAHGPVHAVDNEAARAAKPPSVTENAVIGQGALRPAGAFTSPVGGFVAPLPGSPDNILLSGSERAENASVGAAGEGLQGANLNPHALPDTGVLLPGPGQEVTGAAPAATGGGTAGFTAPEPASDSPDDKSKKSKSKDSDTAS